MDIFSYFRNKGIDTVNPTFYRQIEIWRNWYNSNVKKFHRYKVYRSKGASVNCLRHSLGMAKKVCEDMADLLLNEHVAITIADPTTDTFVKAVLEANTWEELGNEFQEWKAALGTVAYVVYIKDATVDMGSGRKVFSPLSEVYNGYLDNAITMMASGAFDYNTLIRKVVGEMTTSGLRTVDYVSGRSNRVDVAVRRALLTGMGQLTGQISRMNGQRLGTDKYEVDWHPGARPEHAVWQGRVWTYQQLIDVCGLGSGPGLLGWNCRHSYYPFLDGISARNYSDEWLEAMDRKEAQKIPYRGREYNTYEATQKQRQMETAMRAQRQKAQLLKQGGADSDDILSARCKYQAMLDEYKEFSKKFHLPEQRERIYYDLRGRVAPSQRTYKTWEAKQADKAAKRAAAKERKAERAMRERAEKNRRADMDKAAKPDIMNASKAKEEMQVHLVGKINKEIYKCITDDIVTDEVIITDERIAHIEGRHPGDYQRYQQYIADMVLNPDYIIRDDRPFTAMVLKEFENADKSKYFRLALRLLTSEDNQDFKNSVITFMKIREKEYMRLIKNKQVLYKKE